MCTIGPVIWWAIAGSCVRRILWEEGVAKAGTKKILSCLQNAPPSRWGIKGDSSEHVHPGGELYNMLRNGRKYLLVTKCGGGLLLHFHRDRCLFCSFAESLGTFEKLIEHVCFYIYPLVTSAPPIPWMTLHGTRIPNFLCSHRTALLTRSRFCIYRYTPTFFEF